MGKVKVWYDAKGDFLKVIFKQKEEIGKDTGKF